MGINSVDTRFLKKNIHIDGACILLYCATIPQIDLESCSQACTPLSVARKNALLWPFVDYVMLT